ncbi:tRNA (adenine(58)-N(1))-methyltransferase non-catalytic subunit TRM6 [Drosophila guanche]|uniref:tRNA (adenine(58)-N(1))-methyltransferase non-catalytic subunit TRM6 n=1 Tax=Drosophila guanche TaxID=7266 RepID=A0A3B0JIU2_DROGU|nr:tRNA (adenine(58)-N(1))-methyltransferase non-catalytic subunit TRM6 [Drosophila guanche]SPP82344.1 blast:tRNA (adenine(58)-N(1))-methyltransferase non-catalytic subunit TRM6 [Drosophila guanche]
MSTNVTTPNIQLGDYIVIQRQKYTKLQKFGSLDATSTLGKETLELKSLLDQPYGSTFKMCVKETKSGKRGAQRQHTLELCSDTELRSTREVLGISSSGADNRDICDNGEAQALNSSDIEQLREACNESSKIIEKLVENSKTFHTRTEYSQEKYLLKKEKKYFEFVQIRQPTIRLMVDIFYRQDAEKIMGIRVDTLSQIISYSGVCGFGNYLLYESGTNGLLPAAMMNSIGADTEGTLVHMHPGNVPQKQALLALKLPLEQQQRCVSVNLYSVLREFYQGETTSVSPAEPSAVQAEETLPETPTEEQPEAVEPSTKKPKLDEAPPSGNNKGPLRWQLENKRATTLMHEKFDSLVVAAKEHPSSILQALLPLVRPSRPIVVFSTCRELLQETFMELKTSGKVTALHLTSNWLRTYQILPNRTHPEVNMSGNSGYLLTGFTLK